MADPDPLKALRAAAKRHAAASEARDAAIVAAVAAGHSLRTVADAARVTHPTVAAIIARAQRP